MKLNNQTLMNSSKYSCIRPMVDMKNNNRETMATGLTTKA